MNCVLCDTAYRSLIHNFIIATIDRVYRPSPRERKQNLLITR